MLELAALYRDRLGDADQAAVYLHAVLELEPENQIALGAYAEHFREKGDWAALADLLEFSYERARVAGAPLEELLPRLEEIASVTEKQLGDPERALAAWQRAEEIAPTFARARESQRRILLKAKSWDRLAALLEREAAAQTDPSARMDILRRVAQLHREKLGNAKRAIDVYREILRADPHDAVSMRALVEIYEREGDFAGLANALREQIELTSSKQERVGLLRRVLVIYDERTGDLVQGQWAANEILQAVPGDRDTLTRLERILERAGQPADLVRVLELHAQHAANPDEKLQLYRRIAEILYSKLQDPTGAAARLEEVVRLDPDDAKALAGLEQIYTALGRHEDLARVLDMEVERVIADAAAQAEYLRQLARLVEGSLNNVPRARKAWEQLSDLLPTDSEALEALARLYTAEKDWPMLVRILERQAPLATEPGRSVELALERAQIFEEKLRDVDAAAEALERLIAEVDPRNAEAHARLRAYYEQDDDWPKVVKIAERQLGLTDDRAERVRRSMELAELIRDKLGDDRKAIAIYERVLEIDPDDLQALQAVAGLYGKTGNYQRLAYADEKLLERAEDPEARRTLLLQIADIYENHLDDPGRGFEWYRRAYMESPTRREPAARRSGCRAAPPLRRAHSDLRGSARAGRRALRAAGGLAEDRAHLRGEAERSGARLSDAGRRAADRSGRRRAAAQPRAAGGAHRRLEAPARRLRAGGAGAHGDRRAGRAAPAAGRGAREAHGRRVGGARRDAAELRHRAAQSQDARRGPASLPRDWPLGRGDQGSRPPVRAGR